MRKNLFVKIAGYIRTLSLFKLKVFVVMYCFYFQLIQINGQSIDIKAENTPLNEILLELGNKYGLQLSYSHQLISQCSVTESGTFKNPEKAIARLAKICGLSYENNNGVFILYKNNTTKIDSVTKNHWYLYSGTLIDAFNTEPLAYSSIQVPTSNFASDAQGNFSFKSQDNHVKLLFSHLGYYLLDTLLVPGRNQEIKLTPSYIGLDEVEIEADFEVHNAHIGEHPGLLKLNHKLAVFLPGNNNNTMFNHLRLQPGVLASSEGSGFFSIWGSYKGQNLIDFDGITMFSTSSLNNEIGIINPLIINKIEVHKAGYQVDKGDRVGSIIEMNGMNGDAEKFNADINLNTQTLSGYFNLPLKNKNSILVAFRQSYYNLIDWNKSLELDKKYLDDETYIPGYRFRDINIKYSGESEKGDQFYISFIANSDNSNYLYEIDEFGDKGSWENNIQKNQSGLSFFYSKNWGQLGTTNFTFAYSGLKTNLSYFADFDFLKDWEEDFDEEEEEFFEFDLDETYENRIFETSFRAIHNFPNFGSHKLSAGIKYTKNNVEYIYNTFVEDDEISNRTNFFVNDNITIANKIEITPGLKFDYLGETKQLMFQPRIDAKYKLANHWNINAAWGKYNQYISELWAGNENQNNLYTWVISDDRYLPVVESYHHILGVSYSNEDLIFNVEGFYKTTENMSRNIENEIDEHELSFLNTRSYGIDFFVKKEFKKHMAWVAYTVSRTEERDNELNNKYSRAPHDQKHELKGAAIFNIKPWYLSLNYVYGSGLYNTLGVRNNGVTPYNRLDVALLYRMNVKKIKLESGFSIVNVLNTDNLGYSGLSSLPDGEKVYSRSIPFTPNLFLNIKF